MGAVTFPSRWGGYNVTQVELACAPEPLRGSDGTITQRVATFESNDISEAMTVTTGTLFKSRDGRCRFVSYQGERRTVLKPAGRKIYLQLLRNGYKLERARIDQD